MGTITGSTLKKLKVEVWNHRTLLPNQFLGQVHTPGAGLHALGPGTHTVWVPLTPSKKHSAGDVGGEVALIVVNEPLPLV